MPDPTRRRVTMNLGELTNVQVSAISLVKNAANRSPFKIIKSASDEGTMDLSKLFANVRKAEKKQKQEGLAAVIVPQEHQAAAESRIAEVGLTVKKKSEVDGVVVLALVDDLELEEASVMKMDETAAVALVGEPIKKMFADWPHSDSTFSQNMATTGFYPSVRVANDVLYSSIYHMMESAEEGSSPASSIQALLAEYSDYIMQLVNAVPVTAFKFEKLEKSEPAKKSEAVDEPAPTADAADPTDDAQKEDTQEPDSTEPDASGNEPVDGGGNPVDDAGNPPDSAEPDASGDVTKDDDTAGAPEGVEGGQEPDAAEPDTQPTSEEAEVTKADLSTMLEDFRQGLLNDFTAKVTDLQAEIKKSVDLNENLGTRITTLEKSMRGVVVTEPGADVVPTKKSEEPQKSVFDNILKFEGFEDDQPEE